MKKHTGKNSQTSLINEYKGNLFEFMVGLELAQSINSEAEFLSVLPPNFHQLLRNYQQYIFEHDQALALFLKEQAKVTATEILNNFPGAWKSVRVIGKVVANDGGVTHEADLLLNSDENNLGISLKIAKKGSYLNTKSAGIRSIFNKYFSSEISLKLQTSLNEVQDIEFGKLSKKLEDMMGLEPTLDFKSWKNEESLSQLPGSLTGKAHQYLTEYYEALLMELTNSIEQLQLQEPQVFLNGLAPMMGFADSSVVQVVMFYDRDSSSNYRGQGVELHEAKELDTETLPKVGRAGGSTSLYIHSDSWKLQLRVKPMNVFTTKAIKVNCSMRYLLPQNE